MFIDKQYINKVLANAKNAEFDQVEEVLVKAGQHKGLSHGDIAILLMARDEKQVREIFNIAGKIKRSIYGNRIVTFAPLYISNYCVNNCKYCGYRVGNEFPRRRLTREEIQQEVVILEKMGHKRLALEAGEDPINCDIDYVLDSLEAIYETKGVQGDIRRVNVNIAATRVEEYKRLKKAGIGTYILFQETYHQPTYENVHISGPKSNYEYHLTAFDRAMEAGIDDVGGGVLFGLYNLNFEVLAMMIHNEHLEEKYGVGFHTLSVPRLKKAEGMDMDMFPHIPNDYDFKKMVAILRLAVPFTGLILSTRETEDIRAELIKYGISQVSAGSCTGVGGYKESKEGNEILQFELSDHRSPLEIVKWLIKDKHIPSFCTACYRKGRTGDRFMQLAKSGNIQFVCQPNALLTLMEYIIDYGDDELMDIGKSLIDEEISKITSDDIRKFVVEGIRRIQNGERDIYI